MRIAYFISSHGFGHAARACAVIEALWQAAPDTRFELLTTTPGWFFEQSLSRPVTVHHVATDLGLVQQSSLLEDLGATIRQLRDWIPFPDRRVDELAGIVDTAGCDRVVCDIAPIGLAVARRCDLPSMLIENFTWDWIYDAYTAQEPAFEPIVDYLRDVFESADQHIQMDPLCHRVASAVRVGPVSRSPRTDRETVRRRLGVPLDAHMVMVTRGGIEWDYEGIEARLDQSTAHRERWIVVPGGSSELRRHGRAVLLPHRSDFFHPDLVQAADAVIGKLGYSTVAEIHRVGIPFGYIPRPTFPESPPLEAWVKRHLPHYRIDPQSFAAWQWLEAIDPLLELPRQAAGDPSGADTIASQILGS